MSMAAALATRQVVGNAYYVLNSDTASITSMQVVAGGWEKCLPHYHIDRADSPYYSIELVVGGNGTLIMGDHGFQMIPGMVFFYGPGMSYQITSAPEAMIEKYFVYFAGETASRLYQEAPFSLLTPLYLADYGGIERLFFQLQGCGVSKSIRKAKFCALQVELLLLTLAEQITSPFCDKSTALASFERCRRFIEENYRTVRSLEEISIACHLDKPYVCRLFKRFASETPYGMLIRLKMDHAAELLLYSNQMVNEIASAVGFDDAYHFSRVFKRVRQLAPTDFVKLVRSSCQKA